MSSNSFGDNPRKSTKVLLICLLLTVLFHWVLMFIPVNWNPENSSNPPERTEVGTVSPRQLNSMRQKWRTKQFLIDQYNQASSKDPSPDAQYVSKRNVRVQKEQRARHTEIQVGKKLEVNVGKKPLKNLGVNFRLNEGKGTYKSRIPQSDWQREQQEDLPLGGNQSVLDDSLPTGSENMLNTRESVYYSFYSRLYRTIGPLWEREQRQIQGRKRIPVGDYLTAAEIVLDNQGYLRETRILQGSGIPELDQAVEQAWHNAPQFPNPPKGLIGADGQVRTGWTFTVRVGEGFPLHFMPPQRHY